VRSLLVTGGAGFIGSNFVHYWIQRYPEDRLLVLDALTYAGNLSSLQDVQQHPTYRFVHGDICDRPLVEKLLREHEVDIVVHFAAESHVDRSIVEPGAFIRTNVIGTHTLLDAAKNVWLNDRAVPQHRFHHVSTDEVYGSLGPSDPAFSETTPYAPNSPYSASKAASDHLVRAYSHTYGLTTTTSNCSNNYGPYQFPEKLIPLMLVNILQGRPLPIYGDGQNIRDWLHVDDHCLGIDLILRKGRPGQVYNIGGREECANLTLVGLLCSAVEKAFAERPDLAARFPACPISTGKPAQSLKQFVKDRPGHDRRYAINCGKAEQELGFLPTFTLEEGLSQTLSWYLDNEAWWRGVMDGSYQRWIETHYEKRA
jgi:dTDP-glucose 4,6-dehydratase